METNTIQSPIPLFDTLDNFTNALYSLPKHAVEHEQEYRHACQFLYSYRGSEATFNSYRREIERLLHWTWFFAKKSLQSLHRDDIEKFIEFCQHPHSSWIGTKNVSRFITKTNTRIPNPEWRPFVATVSKADYRHGKHPNLKQYTLSQKALQAIFAVLGSFFNYLLQEDYIESNPIAQIRQKSKFIRKQQSKQTIRRLSELQWAYVIETTNKMATENPLEHERSLFIMSLLYGMYLRVSELAASKRWEPQMGHFHKDMDNNWWFKTVGKGNKERVVSVSDAMLNSLKRYRTHLGLSSLPSLGETTPLITKERGTGPVTSTRHIRAIVQKCFDNSIDRLQQDNFKEDAEMLAVATVHWLRHTGISDDVKIRPREHVRDDAGHSSSAITDKYIDVELRERNASARQKKINPDT